MRGERDAAGAGAEGEVDQQVLVADAPRERGADRRMAAATAHHAPHETPATGEAPAPVDPAHYQRAVTALGDSCVVQARGAIFSASGVKLVDQGARVDRRLLERLVARKLREPIEQQLAVEGAVDSAALCGAAQALIATAPLARLLAAALPAPEDLLTPLSRLALPPAMAFKLTLMRAQQPSLFDHSVEMALAAVFLGLRSGMSSTECEDLAAAALLHDIGMLYMDPAWRDPQYRLSGRERKHLAAHPITSMLLVRATRAYRAEVEQAILEHHERHDGSGYPRGLRGGALSPMGKVLVLAEVASAMFEKYARAPALRLSLVLRMKHRLFDAALVAHLMPLLRGDIARDARSRPWGPQRAKGELLVGAVEQWSALKAGIDPAELADPKHSPCALLDARFMSLVRALTEAGLHPRNQTQLAESLADDEEGLAELDMLGSEACWELRSIVSECQRRWPELGEGATAREGDAAVALWCAWVESHPAMAEEEPQVTAPGEPVAA
jgi:HD-GYP domain-containing protein (c-di-GMP phosphodiesterase class II)